MDFAILTKEVRAYKKILFCELLRNSNHVEKSWNYDSELLQSVEAMLVNTVESRVYLLEQPGSLQLALTRSLILIALEFPSRPTF